MTLTADERRYLAAAAQGHGTYFLAELVGGVSRARAIRAALAAKLAPAVGQHWLARAFELGLATPGIALP